jgi:hypothetical protein
MIAESLRIKNIYRSSCKQKHIHMHKPSFLQEKEKTLTPYELTCGAGRPYHARTEGEKTVAHRTST